MDELLRNQMTIFEYLDIIDEDIYEQIFEYDLTKGTGFVNGKDRIISYFEKQKGNIDRMIFVKGEYGQGGRTGNYNGKAYTQWHSAKGIEIETENGSRTYGWHEVEARIDKLINKGEYVTDCVDECYFSKHKCNKHELWKIAETLDDIECQKVCCRNCNQVMCGARCNGAEVKPREVVVKGYLDDGYCPNCDGCCEDLVEKCSYCGQPLTWHEWIRINRKE